MKMLGKATLDKLDQEIFDRNSNCPNCNQKIEIYNMNVAGYKKAICKNCDLESCVDTNITCILGSAIRHKLTWNVQIIPL